MKLTTFLGALAALLFAASNVSADDAYPVRPIKLMVGYGAGGSTDVCNRALALQVGKTLGQSIVVENMPGAGSSLSVSFVTRQKPDGYTLGALATGAVLNQVLNPRLNYNVLSDLTPIAMVAQYQVGVLVRPDSPHRSMADLIAASKTKSLSYSTAGIGTPQHLTSQRLSEKTRADWVHVAYKSGPESIMAVLRGEVDFMAQTAEWAPYVRDGRLRLLAVYTDERIKDFAEAPTLKELGHDLVAPSILGVVGPANMPAPIVRRLQNAFQSAMQTKEFQECAHNFSLRPDFKDSASFKAYLKETLQLWTPLLKQFAEKQ